MQRNKDRAIQNSMHIVSLRRPEDECVSIQFLNWILKFKYKWCLNLLLIVLYIAYLMFGTYVLIESEQIQVQEDLVSAKQATLRNSILFYNLYSTMSNENYLFKRHSLPLDIARLNDPNGSNFNRLNDSNKHDSTYKTNSYQHSRDREFRYRLDKALNDLVNEASVRCGRTQFNRLIEFNESLVFVIRLLTTLGNERVNLLLIFANSYTKLFVVFYSLVGIPCTYLLIYHYSLLFTYWIWCATDSLKRFRKLRKRKSELRKRAKRLRKVSKSSSLLGQNSQNSQLNENLKFVLENKSAIVLPNGCINLTNMNRFSQTELDHCGMPTKLNTCQQSSISNALHGNAASSSFNESNRLHDVFIYQNETNLNGQPMCRPIGSINRQASSRSFPNLTAQSHNGDNFRTSKTQHLRYPNYLQQHNRHSYHIGDPYRIPINFNRNVTDDSYLNTCEPYNDLNSPGPMMLTDYVYNVYPSDATCNLYQSSNIYCNFDRDLNQNTSATSDVNKVNNYSISSNDLIRTKNVSTDRTKKLDSNIPIIVPLFLVGVYLLAITIITHLTGKIST